MVGHVASAPTYRLTAAGQGRLSELGVQLPAPDAAGELGLRYCVDWTDQAHHLSGAVGRTLTRRLFELGWLERLPRTRGPRVNQHGQPACTTTSRSASTPRTRAEPAARGVRYAGVGRGRRVARPRRL